MQNSTQAAMPSCFLQPVSAAFAFTEQFSSYGMIAKLYQGSYRKPKNIKKKRRFQLHIMNLYNNSPSQSANPATFFVPHICHKKEKE